MILKFKIFFLLFNFFIACIQANAVVRYVTSSGAGSFNGTSWSNAAPGSSLQFVINSSLAGDEVWVSGGTYLTTNTLNRNISFNMKNGIIIYGSFAGTETSASQRTFSTGPSSILSGEIGVAGIFDNSYHVISNVNLNNTAIIDGFVIRGANDNRAPTFTNGLGGGIYNDGGFGSGQCSPVIRNCLITNNQSVFGAGIFNSGHSGGISNPLILNCIITNNNALDGGGGIDNFGLGGNASPAITNCVIYNNTANTAGGMYCWGGNINGNSNPVILNCAFVKNQAIAGNAGGIIADNSDASGGGNSGTSNPVVRNSIFWDNTASGTGPQFFIKGTATFTATYSDINLTSQNPPHIISGTGTGNINLNPLFVSILNGAGTDNFWMSADDGLTFMSGSPCINSGNNTGVTLTDLHFNPRITNSIVDMGPYEFIPQNKILNLKTFIQGFYDPSLNITISDTLKICMRNNNSPYAIVDSSKTYLDSNGIAIATFSNVLGNVGYYVQVFHRNSIETWCANPQTFVSNTMSFDLSVLQSNAFGNNQISVDSSPVTFAIYGGDANQDGTVDVSDIVNIYNDANNLISGYVNTDVTGDNFVDVGDLVLTFNNSNSLVSKITP